MTKILPFSQTVTGRTNNFGEVFCRSDGKPHIPRKKVPKSYDSKIKKFFHIGGIEHECNWEHAQYSTGGGWMADVCECDICTICGEIINWEKVY